MKRNMACIALALLCCAGCPASAEETAVQVELEQQPLVFAEAQPYLDENGRTVVPAAEIALALGMEKTWDEETKTAYFRGNSREIAFAEGAAEMEKDGKRVGMDTCAVIRGGKLMVPLRALAEGTGLVVSWDAASRTVHLSQPAARAASFENELLSGMKADEDFIISPFSLRMAIAMVANGAEGETQKELLSAVGIDDLEAFNEQSRSVLQSPDQFRVANSLWLNRDYLKGENVSFSDAFRQTIADYYGGTAETIGAADAARINSWVSEKTNGKIKNIVSDEGWKDLLSAIVNAVHFKDAWAEPFQKEATAEGTFTRQDGTETTMDFMHQRGHFAYYADETCRAVRLPYENAGRSMIVVLPEQGYDVRDCDVSRITSSIREADYPKIDLKLPRFETEYEEEMKAWFQALGVARAFSNDNPDFAPMYTGLPMDAKIDTIVHKAYIKVDEEGTEAAAATMVGMVGATAYVPEEPIDFHANRPFLYMIYDGRNDAVLFLGAVTGK